MPKPIIAVIVETYLATENWQHMRPESTKIIDHNNSSDRKWLGNHCHWGLRNGRIILTQAVADSN